MSRREGFITRAETVLPRRPSPHSQVPVIGTELRTFWPGNATRADVVAVVTQAYEQALQHIALQPFTAEEWDQWRARRG